MRDSALHSIQAAEDLLRKSHVRQSLEALGEIDIESISPSELSFYYLVWSEAKLAMGDLDVEVALRHVMDYYRINEDIERLARAKFLSGWHLSSQGKFFDAKEPLHESFITFKRVDNSVWQGRVLSRLSYIAHQIGEFKSAIGYLKKSLAIFDQSGDTKNCLIISMNLAQLHTALGELSEAISTYNDTEPRISIVNPKNASVFFLLSALPRAFKGDLADAKSTIEKAQKYLPGLKREQAIYFEYLGWIYNLDSEYERALTTLRQGLEISLEIAPQSSLISQTKRLMADGYVALEQYEMARKFAGEALAVAEGLNERVEIACCHRIYAQIDAAIGNSETAKNWFGKAMEMFSMVGARYELACTRYLAAVTGIYPNGEGQALLYLAREYFKGEGVNHFVEKIDRGSNGPPHKRALPGHRAVSAPTIICRSASMKRLVELAEHIAPSGMSVLLTGPTGTGKDLLARYIHHFSGRSGRFISVNAAAIPTEMIESELFGYHRGAYTGAAMTTSGWIEESEGGTFYLNEIADASPELQAKLLDVIENRRICRLGERREREIDCRFIAATNHPLEKLIEDGSFRLDLFHRLNEIPIHLPPLSERREDIELLLKHFLDPAGVKIVTKTDRAALASLVKIFHARPWQGNVRQLEIEVKRLALVCRGDIPRMVEAADAYRMSTKEETLAALQRAGWNRREVGRMLGISESTVRHRIKVYNLSENM